MVVHSLILEAEAGDKPAWATIGTVSKQYTKKKKKIQDVLNIFRRNH